jgi:tetratricopeptide (TPR) repeat protein
MASRGLSKKKIVFLAAGPMGCAHLQLDKEIREIEAGLRAASLRRDFQFKPVLAARTRDMQHALLTEKPQIVHFAGHGRRNGQLLVEDDAGRAQPIAADALAELFELCSQHVECVLLNACYTEMQAQAISEHIPYVVGTTEALDDQAAISFSIGFYGALGEGKAYEDAFRFGRSLFRLDFPHLPPPVLKAKPGGLSARARAKDLGRMSRDQLHQLALQYKLSLANGLDDAETHLALGSVYLSLELYDLAIQHLKKAIDRDPALADAYYLLALTGIRGRPLERLPLQDVRGLEGYLLAAIEIDDRRAQYYYLLALIKEGYYDRNGLDSRPPEADLLLAMARDRGADPGERERLLSALPLLDPALAAKVLHGET